MDLENKDQREKELDQKLEIAAKVELEEWYAEYEKRIAANKAENRRREKPLEDDSGDSLEWDKVIELCGFRSPKSVKDTSRMRSILLKLKESKT